MKRGKSKRSIRKRLAVLMALAISVSMLSSVIVTPRKAAEAEAGYLTDFAVSALENVLMEALGWAADKTENEGIQDIYKMMSVATGGSGTDAIIQYCKDIQDTLGVIRQDIGRMDSHLSELITDFQNRVTNLYINSIYSDMTNATERCDFIINAYNDYVDAAEEYASAQEKGDTSLIEEERQEADDARKKLADSLIRVDKDITSKNRVGQIGTEDYDGMLSSVNKSAGTETISHKAGKPGSFLQDRSATFTGVLYESYSLENNIFDHQHREAIETGMNASVSQFAKILLAYRIQLDYVSAENADLVEQKKLSQEEADNRMEAYEGKYTDYINAVTNACNDVGTMYQNELGKMMHVYDKLTVQKMLHNKDHSPGTKKTRWYHRGTGQMSSKEQIESIEEDPGTDRDLDLFTNDPSGFFRGNVNGVSYLISKKSVRLVPEDFVYTATGNKDGGDYLYKLRSRYFYNFMTTTDGAYQMIQGPNDLSGLFQNVPAWKRQTDSFLNYLSQNGQLGQQEDMPFDKEAEYIVLSEEYKEDSEHGTFKDTDGSGKLEYSFTARPHYTFYQNMRMLKTDFTNQDDLSGKKENYNSFHTDKFSGVLLIMKANEEVTPAYSVYVSKKDASNEESLKSQQVEVSSYSNVPAGEQLKIKVTPDKGWTLESLKIKDGSAGDVLDTLSGPQTFNYVKEDGSYTFLYNMPYRDIQVEAYFDMERGGVLDGDGSEENPYLIKDVKDYLAAVRLINKYTLDAEAYYTVVNDIDFSGLDNKEKTQIEASFDGVWDGNGHTFKNLGPRQYNIHSPSPWMLRITEKGVVKNLTFENSLFSNFVTSNYGIIDSCASVGDAQNDWVGMASENSGKILNCYNTVLNISGDSYKAAIVENNRPKGLVANCWNRGDFANVPNNGYIGGLVVFNEGRLYNCYNTGKPDNSKPEIFGPLIFWEDIGADDEKGITVENSFYPDSLEKWSILTYQKYSVGTQLEDREMHSDDGLLKKLNEGVGKAKADGLELKYWKRSDEVNDGYPTFADIGDEHGITVESEYGAAELTFMDGTKVEGTAPAHMPLSLTVTPDKNREIEKITFLKTSGEVLENIPVTDWGKDIFTTQVAMPEEDCILRVEYYQFLKDGDTYLIGDYPALLSVARAVDVSDYFASANFRLTADIKGNNQEWPLPIGTGREYNGTFDGAGFSIARLWFDQDQTYGGIFGIIGKEGIVKNLGVFGFTVKGDVDNAGGIAAYNKGTIDNCYSGTAQLGEGSYIDNEGEHSLRDLNSSVNGDYAGGIAGGSQGIIVNSRSGADVYGTKCAGGIAGNISGHVEEGHGIFNSYVIGNVNSGSVAGGIAGYSQVYIDNVYFAGTFRQTPGGADAHSKGSIVGSVNTGMQKNCYFLDSTAPSDDRQQHLEGMEPVTEQVMRSRNFADTLNQGVTKAGYDYWTQKDSQRRGYPYLTHNAYVEQSYTDPATGITISGMIHAGAVLNVQKLGIKDDNYKVLNKYVDGQKLKAVFDIGFTITGRDQKESPFTGTLTLTLPMEEKDRSSRHWIVHYNGEELHVHKDTKLQDGRLEVQVETLNAFGIIAKQDADEASWNSRAAKVKTGDDNNLGLLLAAVSISILVIAAGLYYRKRRK